MEFEIHDQYTNCSMNALKTGICRPDRPDRTVIHSRKLKCRWLVGAWRANPKSPARPVRAQSYSRPDRDDAPPCERGGTSCATASPTLQRSPPVAILVATGRAWSLDSYHATNELEGGRCFAADAPSPALANGLRNKTKEGCGDDGDDGHNCEKEGAGAACFSETVLARREEVEDDVGWVHSLLQCWRRSAKEELAAAAEANADDEEQDDTTALPDAEDADARAAFSDASAAPAPAAAAAAEEASSAARDPPSRQPRRRASVRASRSMVSAVVVVSSSESRREQGESSRPASSSSRLLRKDPRRFGSSSPRSGIASGVLHKEQTSFDKRVK
jgi:hypothetical protein